jgi:hypothetical protein
MEHLMTIEFKAPQPDGESPRPSKTVVQAGTAKVARTPASLARQRHRVMARMWAAAEGQIEEIESRLAGLQGGGGDVEREARTLALLARVVRELSREADSETPSRAAPRSPARRTTRRFPAIHRNDPAGAEDEQTARNLDQLRDDLARHLQRLRDKAGAASPAGDAERG